VEAPGIVAFPGIVLNFVLVGPPLLSGRREVRPAVPQAATLTSMPQSTLLEKFGSALDGIEPMNVIEQWFYYFRNMKNI
jgi:hypothetical protein